MADVKRITKKDKFEMVKEIVLATNVENKDELVEFIDHEVELISKKRNGQTANQKANEGIMDAIYEVLANAGDKMTATEVANAGIEGVTSNQKASALLKKMVDAGRVEKIVEGKKSYFIIND